MQPSDPHATIALPSAEVRLRAEIEQALRTLDSAPAPLRPWLDATRELCLAPAKRVRPRLCRLAYEGVAGAPAPQGVFTFGAGLELLHGFMLVHDDLIDRAPLRRGRVTLQHREDLRPAGAPSDYLNHLAMLAGDLLFTLAIETMSRADLPPARVQAAIPSVLASAREAALGESLELLYAQQPLSQRTSAELAEVPRLKTAGYTFVAPLVAGATLAGAGQETRDALAAFGERVGLAFQLADDLLDLFGGEVSLGKPVGGDVREGKRTALMRLTLERLGPVDAERLNLALGGDASVSEVAWVTEQVGCSGAAEQVADRVRALVSAGSLSLARARLLPNAVDALRTMANDILESLPTEFRRAA